MSSKENGAATDEAEAKRKEEEEAEKRAAAESLLHSAEDRVCRVLAQFLSAGFKARSNERIDSWKEALIGNGEDNDGEHEVDKLHRAVARRRFPHLPVATEDTAGDTTLEASTTRSSSSVVPDSEEERVAGSVRSGHGILEQQLTGEVVFEMAATEERIAAWLDGAAAEAKRSRLGGQGDC